MIKDLHPNDEIFHLFDHTFNDFSAGIVRKMLEVPLPSEKDILYRQQILKAFIENIAVFKDYGYARAEFQEVYDFLHFFHLKPSGKRKLHLYFSEKLRHTTRAKCIQFIVFFHRIESKFLSRTNGKLFPTAYKWEAEFLRSELDRFRLSHFEALVREQNLSIANINQLLSLIAEWIDSGRKNKWFKMFHQFEAYVSVALMIARNEFTFPLFHHQELILENFYHPSLQSPVKNSIATKANVVLLTGPNMSGKSTTLKAIGLCTHLANCGFAVPASRAQIPRFDSVSVFINQADDLSNGYSHFISEILNLKNVLLAARNGSCFAAFDELFRGTNVEDALDIGVSTIDGLSKIGNGLFFISTHFHALKNIIHNADQRIETYYLDCEIVDEMPVFTYKLLPGWSDLKVGKRLFEKEGLYDLLGEKGS